MTVLFANKHSWQRSASLTKSRPRSARRRTGRMALAINDDTGMSLQRNLSEWWSEETEYVFQRIERWAAFARGYNRLRSQRLSKGRMTMSNDQDSSWSISSDNKLVIDDNSWCPQFYSARRAHRRKSRPEETKINCCGTLNYQSNSNLDSSCLETYRYDHSIYFKTIGDIKNSKKNLTNEGDDRVSISSEELVEWEPESVHDLVEQLNESDSANNNRSESIKSVDPNQNEFQPVWPIVDMAHLNLSTPDSPTATSSTVHHVETATINLPTPEPVSQSMSQSSEECNNNYFESVQTTAIPPTDDNPKETTKDKNPEGIKRLLSFRQTRRLSRSVRQSPVLGENNVVWPRVLLNYVKNANHLPSSPVHCQVNVK